jgi:hypothetical protein
MLKLPQVDEITFHHIIKYSRKITITLYSVFLLFVFNLKVQKLRMLALFCLLALFFSNFSSTILDLLGNETLTQKTTQVCVHLPVMLQSTCNRRWRYLIGIASFYIYVCLPYFSLQCYDNDRIP